MNDRKTNYLTSSFEKNTRIHGHKILSQETKVLGAAHTEDMLPNADHHLLSIVGNSSPDVTGVLFRPVVADVTEQHVESRVVWVYQCRVFDVSQ